MSSYNSIQEVFTARETMEGAGVRLHRAFGYHQVPRFDPFLMLDDFRGDNPSDYIRGFPWHPHRGIETVTYMLEGEVEHGDSMGNAGTIGAGDIQWMTAGSGIIHQEMPKPKNGRMGGFQLWLNLPRSDKLHQPRYQEIRSAGIPMVVQENGVRIRVIAGTYAGLTGPVRDIVADPEYFDVSVPPGESFQSPGKPGYTRFMYIFQGTATIRADPDTRVNNRDLILFSGGAEITLTTDIKPCRFLLISGKPIKEPIAWGGPIVMNTQEELDQAFREYQDGTFIKSEP